MSGYCKNVVSTNHLKRRAKVEPSQVLKRVTKEKSIPNVEIDFDKTINIPDESSSSICDKEVDGRTEEVNSSMVCEYSNVLQYDHSTSHIEEPQPPESKDSLARFQVDSFLSDEFETNDVIASIPEKLRAWNLKHNVTLSAFKEILDIFRPLVPSLPHDPHTLYKTPRTTPPVMLRNGAYIHIGLIKGFMERLRHGSKDSMQSVIAFDINIAGISLTESTVTDIWPILCRSLDLNDSRPFVVGVFVGTGKPDTVEQYLEAFILECLKLIKIGLVVEEKEYRFCIRCFICDSAVRQYLKKICGHAAHHGCERCEQMGDYKFNRMCYSLHVHRLRTNGTFLSQTDGGHHTGISPLLALQIGMVSQFVLDPFLVIEGAVKQFLSLLHKGSKSLHFRLSTQKNIRISERLLEFRKYVPKEFASRSKLFFGLSKWKGADLRFYLLYAGYIAMKGIVDEALCKIFLMLQIPLIIFSVKELLLNENHFAFAKSLLEEFVRMNTMEVLFQEKFCTNCIHSLLHLPDDVKLYGDASTVSAFPFESYLGLLKKIVQSQSPRNAVQQLVCRLEKENYLYDFKERDDSIRVSCPILGSNQFETLTFPSFMLSAKHTKDSYFQYDGSVASVVSIQKNLDESIVVVANVCDTKTDFFTYPCNSSIYSIFNLGNIKWRRKNIVVPVSDIRIKYVVLPCKQDMIAMPMLPSS